MWLLNKTQGAVGCGFQEQVLKDEPVKKQILLVMQKDEE